MKEGISDKIFRLLIAAAAALLITGLIVLLFYVIKLVWIVSPWLVAAVVFALLTVLMYKGLGKEIYYGEEDE